MTREVVVAIMGQQDNGEMVAYLDSDSAHENANDFCPLVLNGMPPLDTSINVTAYGTAVREALISHPAIGHELVEIFGLQLPDRSSLKFLIKTPNAEQYRWETLYANAPARFLGISDICTISRVTPAKPGAALRAFTYPLRMIAFLSAAGMSARGELLEIWTQVVAARRNGLDVTCSVYLGEQELLDVAQKLIARGEFPGVLVEPMPSTAIDIGKLLKNAQIQFLHFFCHGIERAGVQGLSLATINDHDKNEANGNAPASSIVLSVDALSEALALNTSIWLTVLNSCSMAQVAQQSDAQVVKQLHSMALNVARKGCPYTVGMAEPIDVSEATTFSQAFYGELFAIVRKDLEQAAGEGPRELDLAPAVLPGRKKFHDLYLDKATFGRWSLPLLYQRTRQPLVVQSIAPKQGIVPAKDLGLANANEPADEAKIAKEIDAAFKQIEFAQDVQPAIAIEPVKEAEPAPTIDPMAKRIQEIARTLQALPADTPEDLRKNILAILDKDPKVPPQLRPNIYGTFA
jgi:hypothetical protein